MLLTTSGPVISPWLRDQSWSQPTNQEACSPIPGLWLVDCIHRWKAWCFSNHGSLSHSSPPACCCPGPGREGLVRQLRQDFGGNIIRGIYNIDHETLDCRPRPRHATTWMFTFCIIEVLMTFIWILQSIFRIFSSKDDWRCSIFKKSPYLW